MGGSRLYPLGTIFPKSGKIFIKFCEPILPQNFKDHNEIRIHTRKVFLENFEFKQDS